MTRSTVAAVLIALLLAAPLAALAAESSAQILGDPLAFDGKPVTLYGKVTRLRTRVSPKGETAFTFVLNDAKGTITVSATGEPACPNGVVATVEGVFRAAKAGPRGGKPPGRNRVDATRISC